jgi:hypothetical protein
LKLKCDILVSSSLCFFKCNLYRYAAAAPVNPRTFERSRSLGAGTNPNASTSEYAAALKSNPSMRAKREAAAAAAAAGRRTLTPPDPQLKGAWYSGGFNP